MYRECVHHSVNLVPVHETGEHYEFLNVLLAALPPDLFT